MEGLPIWREVENQGQLSRAITTTITEGGTAEETSEDSTKEEIQHVEQWNIQ